MEEQWHKEEGLLRDRLVRNGKDRGCGKNSFPVDNAGISVALDCKMSDLPEGCEIYHFVKMEEKFLNLFLIWDKQRSFGGSEYTLVVVVPDNCGTVTVNSVVPTIVCGGKIDFFVSSNEILSPSVRARLLSVFGQKELSVHCGVAVFECETDEAEVLLKDCSFAQRAEAIIQVRYDFSDEGGFVGSVFRRLSLYGRFVFDPVMTRAASCGSDLVFFTSKCAGWCQGRNGIEKERFSKFFHRTSKRNAVHHIRNWANDIKDELLKVPEEERLEKYSNSFQALHLGIY